MKINMKNHSFLLTCMLSISLIGGTTLSLKHNEYRQVKADGNSERIVFDEDFSFGGGVLADFVRVEEGEAVWTATGPNYFFMSNPLDSNNYEVSFDMKWLSNPGNIYFDMVGLDGSKHNNIFMGILSGSDLLAPYWALYEAGDASGQATIFNNSGTDQGGLDSTPVDMSNYVNVKYIHFEGYVELWVNNNRLLVSHLSNFGNNRYGIRKSIAEGKITGFGFNISKANCVVLDNFSVKEAVGKDTEGLLENTASNHSSIMGLSAQNLYGNNFIASGSFDINSINTSEYYPTISLLGLNGGLLDGMSSKFYGLNFQSRIIDDTYQAQVFAQKTGSDEWASATADPIHINVGDSLNYKIEVSQDDIRFYINNSLLIETTFTTLGIPKGHLQYIQIRDGEGGASWTSVSYEGWGDNVIPKEGTDGVYISCDKTSIYTTESTTINATIYGYSSETFNWYVNEEVVEETSTTLTLSNLISGTYQIVFKSAEHSSNVIDITVLDVSIEISVNKSTFLQGETAVIKAVLFGFDTTTVNWYVNQQIIDDHNLTLNLDTSGLSGSLSIVAEYSSVYSNIVNIGVAYDVWDEFKNDEGYDVSNEIDLEGQYDFGGFTVGTDDTESYLYTNSTNGAAFSWWWGFPTSSKYVFSYKMFIPNSIEHTFYFYPVLGNLFADSPGAPVEFCIEVTKTDIRPYLKNSDTGKMYQTSQYGFGKNLAYGGGIINKDQWNEFALVVNENSISIYVNGTQVLFYGCYTGIPQYLNVCSYPAGGDGPINAKFKDFTFFSVPEPIPDIESVTISVSRVILEVGESVSLNAKLNPSNAVAKVIEWFVNDNKVDCSSLTYVFNAEQIGEYDIYCVVDGVKSPSKKITVNAPSTDPENPDGEGKKPNIILIVSLSVVGALALGGVIVFIILRKKKK